MEANRKFTILEKTLIINYIYSIFVLVMLCMNDCIVWWCGVPKRALMCDDFFCFQKRTKYQCLYKNLNY